MHIRTMTLGPIEANCYILWDEETKDTAVIDPGYPSVHLLQFLQEEGLQVTKILLTHGHFDHIGAVGQLREAYPAVQVYIHSEDAHCLTSAVASLSTMMGRPATFAPAECIVQGGECIPIGNETCLTVLHTPGHTTGGVCYVGEAVMFTGDTLFCGSIGRTDFPGGSISEIMQSLEKIKACGNDFRIYPGHGPATDMAYEKQMNPYMRRGCL